VIDRQRLAGILGGAKGDAYDLAEEVVTLMGAKRAAEEQLRGANVLAALRDEQTAEAVAALVEMAEQVTAVLNEVPKTKRGQFVQLEKLVAEVLAGAT
jgi:hypothetical protein